MSEDLEALYRRHARGLILALARRAGEGDEARAEAAVHEAFVRAQTQWAEAAPENSIGWLRAVARNVLVDDARKRNLRRGLASDALPAVAPEPEAVLPGEWDEELLRMIFTVCDPALTLDGQVAFALRVLCGLEIQSLAALFGTSEATIRKRLSRARRTLAARLETPLREHSAERLDGVLRVLYAVFSEGHKARSGDLPLREDLVREAMRLAEVLRRGWLGPTRRIEALLALMKLTAARIPARRGVGGVLVPLDRQDRTLWDQSLIHEGLSHLAATAHGETVLPLQLEAAIAGCHAVSPSFGETDWDRLVALYHNLYAARRSVVVGTNLAMATGWRDGAEAGLAVLDSLDGRNHLPWHASRGELLGRAGDALGAEAAFRRAAALAGTAGDAAYFQRRADEFSRALPRP